MVEYQDFIEIAYQGHITSLSEQLPNQKNLAILYNFHFLYSLVAFLERTSSWGGKPQTDNGEGVEVFRVSTFLCAWDNNVLCKEHHTISDNFIAVFGTWIPTKMKVMIISVYAPQADSYKRALWSYLELLVNRWNGESIIMGDFNEVRRKEERWGSTFNAHGARVFNNFISNAGLVDLQLEGFSFTWSHPSASKMSKLDRFLVTDGLISSFPHISAVCLDRHLSDHRPILLREVITDFGATPFRLYHSWFSFQGFDQMVSHVWNSTSLNDSNDMIRFKKKLQILKKQIRVFVVDQKKKRGGCVKDLKDKLSDIDSILDKGGVNDDILLARTNYMNLLLDAKAADTRDYIQKAKIQWAVEGDENSKFFHGIVNRKRANLTVKGIMVDGVWVDEPSRVKKEFRDHFAARFQDPGICHGKLNFSFPNRLSSEQVAELEIPISKEEIRNAVWGCGENKSPGPDGFTFEFFRKYWHIVGTDFCLAVEWFFNHDSFSVGCNSSFIALIPKSLDPKLVSDFRPISLIGSVYKVITKILQNRLSFVISDLISDVQSAFLPNRQIFDGPFILNDLLARCRFKKQSAMVFKVDFAKAYDSIRWDYLEDVLHSFGFGVKWRSWIKGCLSSSMASILVNGSPTSEFQFHRGLKQGDPLAPYLFILIMESLHLSFSRVIDAGIFTGVRIDFMRMTRKSNLLGVGVPSSQVLEAANSLGCSVMKMPFKYLGINVGGNNSLIKAWDESINKLKTRLSKWKLKTLSIGGRLTLLKSVLGSTPIYNMSLYKVPKAVLSSMEAIRRDFFNGSKDNDRKIAWVKWAKVLAPRKHGGLGVSSFYALNRALLLKWVWRFISRENSLWSRFIHACHGSNWKDLLATYPSNWCSIVKEVKVLKDQGIDFLSHCKIKIGNGRCTRFWTDLWIGDDCFCHKFPRLYALEVDKDCYVDIKLKVPVASSFRRMVRGGVEASQLAQLNDILGSVSVSNSEDRWVWDMNGDGVFRVKDVRNLLDETFLPKSDSPTRWVRSIPIKINIFAWKVSLDRLPTRVNLVHRGVLVSPISCPIGCTDQEDSNHILFRCDMAVGVTRSTPLLSFRCYQIFGGVTRDNNHASTPLPKKKQVTFEEQCAMSKSNTHKPVEQLNCQKTNVPVSPSTGVNSCTDASRSQPRSNTKKNRILPAKSVDLKKVEEHPRKIKSSLKTMNRVDSSISSKHTVVQIILWYLDSGCSKHMTGDRSRLRNFVKKFIGTVRFGNDHFGAIMGYEDYVIGESVISRVYYVEGLGHNLFFVGQFCDSNLKVAFRKHSCYVRDTDGVELIKGSRGSNLYTISIEDMMKSS
ncbi:RNA-directed DNA polymerase, eukaryota [Tanacetum coccineum]